MPVRELEICSKHANELCYPNKFDILDLIDMLNF